MDGIIPYSMLGDLQQEVSSLGSGFNVKGTVTYAQLPETGELGDLYLVSDRGYASYVWTGSSWEEKGSDTATRADIIAALYT